MKHVKITSKAIIYSFVFFMIVNISDAKADKSPEKQQDCRSYLVQINQYLLQDPDGILNEEQVAGYEQCVTNIEDFTKSTILPRLKVLYYSFGTGVNGS